ncbi:hypothetical protein CBL_20301 [Carabus blaptoides fortunei]
MSNPIWQELVTVQAGFYNNLGNEISVVSQLMFAYELAIHPAIQSLCANPFAGTLVNAGVSLGLSRLLGMSLYTTEQFFKDRYGVSYKIGGRGRRYFTIYDVTNTVVWKSGDDTFSSIARTYNGDPS